MHILSLIACALSLISSIMCFVDCSATEVIHRVATLVSG